MSLKSAGRFDSHYLFPGGHIMMWGKNEDKGRVIGASEERQIMPSNFPKGPAHHAQSSQHIVCGQHPEYYSLILGFIWFISKLT